VSVSNRITKGVVAYMDTNIDVYKRVFVGCFPAHCTSLSHASVVEFCELVTELLQSDTIALRSSIAEKIELWDVVIADKVKVDTHSFATFLHNILIISYYYTPGYFGKNRIDDILTRYVKTCNNKHRRMGEVESTLTSFLTHHINEKFLKEPAISYPLELPYMFSKLTLTLFRYDFLSFKHVYDLLLKKCENNHSLYDLLIHTNVNMMEVGHGYYTPEHLQYIYEIIQKLLVLNYPLKSLVWFLEQCLKKSILFFQHNQEHILLEIGHMWSQASTLHNAVTTNN